MGIPTMTSGRCSCSLRIVGTTRWPKCFRLFSNLIAFSLTAAESTCSDDERQYVERLRKLNETEFWPGALDRGRSRFSGRFRTEFWCRMYFDTVRAIAHGKTGNTDHKYWQAQATYQAYSIALLFEYAVRTVDSDWHSDTLDRIELDRVVNGIER